MTPSRNQFFAKQTQGSPILNAAHKQVQVGADLHDGYMLHTGEFRQSISSVVKSITGSDKDHWLGIDALKKIIADPANQALNLPKSLASQDSEPQQEQPLIVRVRVPGGYAYTVGLPTVAAIYGAVARGNGKYSQVALDKLLVLGTVSLEGVYQEAFGVQDTRSVEARLVDWAIRLDPTIHTRLYHGDFALHHARVTGYAIGHPQSALCLADLIYHRLPEAVYETLKDLNPVTTTGWRQHTYSQLMQPELLQQVRELVAVVTHELKHTPSRVDDPKAFRKMLKRLDATHPRYKKRGGHRPA